MLKKNHVHSLIIFTLLFWVFIFVRFYWNNYQNTDPLQLQKALQEDVYNKTKQIDNAIVRGYSGNFYKHLPKDVYFFLYQDDQLKDWNTNIVLPRHHPTLDNRFQLITLDKSKYLIKAKHLDRHNKIIFLIPLCFSYPVENEYLKTHFIANNNIPANTIISSKQLKDGFELKDYSNNILAYVSLNTKEIKNLSPNYLDIILVIIGVFFVYASINISNISLSRKRNQWKGFLFSVFIISFFRMLLYVFGIPFNARQLDFFSPVIYHKNFLLASLGDVFFNALGFMWVVSYVYKYTDYTLAFKYLKNQTLRKICLLFIIAFSVYIFYQAIFITHSLIMDAAISFEISNIKNVSILNFAGLVIMCLISGGVALAMNLINYLINNLTKQKFLKYFLMLCFLVLFNNILPYNLSHITLFFLCIWFILFYVLLDFLKIKITTDVSELSTIFWLLYVCISFTFLLLFFTNKREQKNKINIVNELSVLRRDTTLEKYLEPIVNSLSLDSIFSSYKAKSTYQNITLRNFLQASNFSNLNNAYVVNIDTEYNFLKAIVKNQGAFNKQDTYDWQSTKHRNLLFRENEGGNLEYKLILPFPDNKQVRLTIYFYLRNLENHSIFPELLTTDSFLSLKKFENFAFAKYEHGKLKYHSSDVQFPLFSKHAKLYTNSNSFFQRNNKIWNWYQLPNRTEFVIMQNAVSWLDGVILFSYLFGISIIIILTIILYRLFASLFVLKEYKRHLIVFNFRKKTHYAMLSLVLISFLILGILTISFLFVRFEQNNKSTLLSTAQKFKEPIQRFIFEKHLDTLDTSIIAKLNLQEIVNNSALNTHADINIFGLDGKLLSSSNTDLFVKGIIAPIIPNIPLHYLKSSNIPILSHDEHIGLLDFKVAYMNLFDDNGNTIAYMSMPIYASQKEIRYQITYLVIAMTNLYAFIFVLSTLLAFVVTNGLTRSFNLIIKQFQRVNLQKNELLEWPYDDDIGLMVKEYNKMIKKLEESAHQLAQSEREDAWKDMAKQVAHEIKNPLTPMRLNLQFLQNAINNKQDNALAITKKVTDSLIEQIDNLNYIASEFSNFAKLPDPQVAIFSLNAILENSVSIYNNESNIIISLSLPNHQILIRSDRSHMLRVFSNLLQNAVQAIPEGKQGLINVNLYMQNQLAVIQVKDNGVGIPPSIKSDVFVPHFTTKNAGSGIGLAMTKRIVEYWNGSIWFESIENEGTEFYIKLPILEQTVT